MPRPLSTRRGTRGEAGGSKGSRSPGDGWELEERGRGEATRRSNGKRDDTSVSAVYSYRSSNRRRRREHERRVPRLTSTISLEETTRLGGCTAATARGGVGGAASSCFWRPWWASSAPLGPPANRSTSATEGNASGQKSNQRAESRRRRLRLGPNAKITADPVTDAINDGRTGRRATCWCLLLARAAFSPCGSPAVRCWEQTFPLRRFLFAGFGLGPRQARGEVGKMSRTAVAARAAAAVRLTSLEPRIGRTRGQRVMVSRGHGGRKGCQARVALWVLGLDRAPGSQDK